MQRNFADVAVAVIGDLVLDCYVEGEVHRVSPEAPIPVLLCREEQFVAGGAANVAANLAALEARVEIVGLTGDDGNGALLRALLKAIPGTDASGVVTDASRPTTTKRRVMSGRHQIVRLDAEATHFVTDEAEGALIAAARGAVARCDVVILSDYAKGACSDRVLRAAIDAAREAGKPVVVDPKRRDLGPYAGATLITPNRRELGDATGFPVRTDAEVELAAEAAITRTGSAILLTRSEQGMSYCAANETPIHLPTAARDVFDVSGAGDTVVAMLALGYATGRSIVETMRLANTAAGIVVGKVGTTPVTAAELEAALEEEAHHGGLAQGELVTLEDAVARRRQWGRRGLRVGFTNGCFDLLHPGHVGLLRQAAAKCDKLIVAINSDASVRRLKGENRPVQDEAARACVLGALSVVDLVVVFDEPTPAQAINALVPDLLVKGADYSEDQVVGAETVKAAGGRVLLVPLVAGRSTTATVASLRAGGKTPVTSA